MTYLSVLFELDGTLIDSEPVFKVVAKRAAREFDQCFTDELYLDLVGLPGIEVESGIREAFGQNFPMEEFRDSFATNWEQHVGRHGIAIKSGALDLVDRLDELGVAYAIATSTPHNRALQSLQLAGLENRFKTVIGGDQIEHGKPAPDSYLLAAKTIATEPNRCIAIEDSKVGVRAAAAAKMYTIMIPDIKAADAHTRALATEILPSMDAATDRVVSLLSY